MLLDSIAFVDDGIPIVRTKDGIAETLDQNSRHVFLLGALAQQKGC